jgi:hypothetical protein
LDQQRWEAEVYLVCPDCESRFRIGLNVPISPAR